MITKSEAIQNFLKKATSPIAKLYTPEMEVQVNVIKGETLKSFNDRVYEDLNTGERWSSFRIPFLGQKDSHLSLLQFDLCSRAEGIGMSGWNWMREESIWVGFDFDSIVNHQVGLTSEQLEEIKEKLVQVPYVTLLKSTSGKGYHVYVTLDKPVATKERELHSSLAKSILSVMSIDAGHDFKSAVDVCGAILWCWHRKQEGTDGLSVIKYATENFDVLKIPPNWKDYSKDEIKKMSKVRRDIYKIADGVKNLLLSESHRKVLSWFSKQAKEAWWWETDNNMLVCHTFDLKRCHEDLKLLGYFETGSSGSSSQNAFAFPSKEGSWVIRRFTKGVKEHPIWSVDDKGWTKLRFNVLPSYLEAVNFHGGELDRDGWYNFSGSTSVNLVLADLNIPFRVDSEMLKRNFRLKYGKGKIIISTEETALPLEGFLKHKKNFEKVLYFKDLEENETLENVLNDDKIRHVVSQGTEAGWYINIGDRWIHHPKTNVIDVLLSEETVNKNNIQKVIGESILSPWELIVRPFQEEYLGGRTWNKYAAQFSVKPEMGECNTFLSILGHLGKELDKPVSLNEWCAKNKIKTGLEYLFLWVASMFQKPLTPLPYLFFWSVEEDTGKSTFHEALRILFKDGRGYVRADHALTSQGGFNFELCGAVLCVIEETDLSADNKTTQRIKDYVTGKTLAIRAMHKNVFLVENTSHWCQFSNNPNFCLIGDSDTRIISIRVDSLKSKDKIPKDLLFKKLEFEAGAFLHKILKTEIPEPEGRLGLPCLITQSKKDIIRSNTNHLDQFIEEKIYFKRGHKISFSNFCHMFDLWLLKTDSKERSKWSKRTIAKKFKSDKSSIFKGRLRSDNNVYIFNASLDPEAKDEGELKKFIMDGEGKV